MSTRNILFTTAYSIIIYAMSDHLLTFVFLDVQGSELPETIHQNGGEGPSPLRESLRASERHRPGGGDQDQEGGY